MILSARPLITLLMALSLTACATTEARPPSGPPAGFQGAVTQPFDDLNLMRQVSPAVLVEAAAAPYAAPESCAAAEAAITELDVALGADVDTAPVKRAGSGSALLVDAVRSLVALPYRGVIRKVSGADRRERLRTQAVLAGMVRRGFLKGWVQAQACPQGAA